VVVQDDLFAFMHPAVDLDDQPQRHAGEIDHEPADRVLAAHLPAVDGAATQSRPYPLLGQPADLAQPAGARRQAVGRHGRLLVAHPSAKPSARASATDTANDSNTLRPASVILLPTAPNRAILSRFVRRGRVARPGGAIQTN
jgi:hypothetical protein